MEYYQKISYPHCGKNDLEKAGKVQKVFSVIFVKRIPVKPIHLCWNILAKPMK
jgi:hypothetical protein